MENNCKMTFIFFLSHNTHFLSYLSMFLVDLFQYSDDVTNDVILNCIFIPYNLLDKMKFQKLFSSLYNYILGVVTEKP